jgi:hypothetical protein
MLYFAAHAQLLSLIINTFYGDKVRRIDAGARGGCSRRHNLLSDTRNAARLTRRTPPRAAPRRTMQEIFLRELIRCALPPASRARAAASLGLSRAPPRRRAAGPPPARRRDARAATPGVALRPLAAARARRGLARAHARRGFRRLRAAGCLLLASVGAFARS